MMKSSNNTFKQHQTIDYPPNNIDNTQVTMSRVRNNGTVTIATISGISSLFLKLNVCIWKFFSIPFSNSKFTQESII